MTYTLPLKAKAQIVEPPQQTTAEIVVYDDSKSVSRLDGIGYITLTDGREIKTKKLRFYDPIKGIMQAEDDTLYVPQGYIFK
jgi:hypothetical protein